LEDTLQGTCKILQPSKPMQPNWVKETRTLLTSLYASPSTTETIHRRRGSILLRARVQPSRLSISTTGGRLERERALVIFPFPFFFNFQLVCAYVCVVFSVFILNFSMFVSVYFHHE
jgi:hypothetical protein